MRRKVLPGGARLPVVAGRIPFRTRYADSRVIFIASLRALGDNRDLWIFPALLGLTMLAIVGVVAGATMLFVGAGVSTKSLVLTPMLMLACLPLGFLGSLLQTALAWGLLQRMEGNVYTARDAWNAALERKRIVLWYSVLSFAFAAVLGIVGQFLDNLKMVPWLGRIADAVGTLAWAAATFFVVPVIAAVHPAKASTAVRQSAALARDQWGKTVSGIVTLGLVLLVPFLVALVPFFALGILFFLNGLFVPGVVAMLMPLALLMLVGLPLQTAALTTYQCALYRFATTGRVPERFGPETLVTPWQPLRG